MIDSFEGEYAFLSNYYPCEVIFGGIRYQSAEAAKLGWFGEGK